MNLKDHDGNTALTFAQQNHGVISNSKSSNQPDAYDVLLAEMKKSKAH